jgi:hypothetical protein
MSAITDIVTAVGGLNLGPALNSVAEAVRPSPEKREDPFSALLRLALDQDLAAAFGVPLVALGYDLQPRELPNPFDVGDPTKRLVSVVTSPKLELYLILVPSEILDEARPENLAAVSLLGYAFAKNSTIYMFARDLRDIDPPYSPMIKAWQQDRSIRAVFKSWRDVTRLLRATAPATQMNLVREILELDQQTKYAAILPTADTTPPTDEEKQRIVSILARQARDPLRTPEEYFEGLLANVQIRPPFKLDRADTEASALELLNFLIDTYWIFPRSHPRSGEWTIGWVLKAVTDQVLAPADNRALVTIILSHNLIEDPKTRNELSASIQSSEGRI